MNKLYKHLTFGKLITAAATSGAILYFIQRVCSSIPKQMHKALESGSAVNQLCRALDSKLFQARSKNVKIVVVKTAHHWENIRCELLSHCHDFRVLGFDCEWVTRKKDIGPVALIQLATHQGLCALIHMSKLQKMPATLQDLLQDRSILKVGVASVDDGIKLYKDHGVCVQGCLDLRHLVLHHPDAEEIIKKPSLVNLARNVLHYELGKRKYVSSSNWESHSLTDKQIFYAADDALVGIGIFIQLLLDIMSDKWSDSSSVLTMSDIWDEVSRLCNDNVDWKYKTKSEMSSKTNVSKADQYRAYVSRKTPLYDNCQLQAPDGEQLCTCDQKKAMWYVLRNLGKVVNGDPLTVRLNFEPAGRPEGKCGQYYLCEKENCCITCGKADSYIRKYVIPHEYRKYFPAVLKDHSSHDVVLMCISCHQESNRHDNVFKMQLAEECDAPVGKGGDVKMHENYEVKKVRSAARALTNPKNKIPAERIEEIKKTILKYYQAEELTPEMISSALKLDPGILNAEYMPHGLKVVLHYKNKAGLMQLEQRWRERFLKTMHPQFLSKLWSVDHSTDRINYKVTHKMIDKRDCVVQGLH